MSNRQLEELSISFSNEMMRVVLNGWKTETRRIVAPQPCIPSTAKMARTFMNESFGVICESTERFIECPYGKIGDVLWVREAWRFAGGDLNEGVMAIQYKTGSYSHCEIHESGEPGEWIEKQLERLEAANHIEPDPENEGRFRFIDYEKTPWNEPNEMPKEMARTWIRIVNIQVENLCSISWTGAISEGVDFQPSEDDPNDRVYKDYRNGDYRLESPITSFKTLWGSIYGEQSWREDNPVVWVITFEVVSPGGSSIREGGHS